VIQNSPRLDRDGGSGRPLVSTDPADPLVADLRKVADSILASVPMILDSTA
jgi:hypothetical protein